MASVRGFNFLAPYFFSTVIVNSSYYRFIYHSIVFAFYHSILSFPFFFPHFVFLLAFLACLEPDLSHETSSILSFPTSSSLFAPQYVASSHIWPAFAPIRKSPQPPETQLDRAPVGIFSRPKEPTKLQLLQLVENSPSPINCQHR